MFETSLMPAPQKKLDGVLDNYFVIIMFFKAVFTAPKSSGGIVLECCRAAGEPFSFALLSDDGGLTWVQSEARRC